MTKRFTTNGYKIYDTFHDGVHWLVNEVEAEEIVEVMNNLDLKARERSKALSKLQKENEQSKKHREELFYRERDAKNDWRKLKYENEQLKQHIDFADKLIDDLGHNEMKRQWEEYE